MNEHEARDEREALQRLIYTFETTDLGDNLAITTRDSYALVDAILAAGYRKHPEPETWTEYRSAVVYLAADGAVGSMRETGPTRHTLEAAREDALNDEPGLDVQDDEPPVARAIVARTRFEPGPWEPIA